MLTMRAFYSTWSVQDLPRPRGCDRRPLEDNCAIDDDVREAFCIRMGLLERRHVTHLGRIEHRDVGLHARPYQAAVDQAEALCREGCHLSHRVGERDRLPLPHVHRQYPGERAVAARMRVGLTE